MNGDIELVIKMPEEVYKSIINGKNYISYQEYVEGAIANGIPLAKGHNRLITEPTEEDIEKTIGGKNDFAECIREAVKTVFDNASTIIPADKEREE